jgi:hypothetical protein
MTQHRFAPKGLRTAKLGATQYRIMNYMSGLTLSVKSADDINVYQLNYDGESRQHWTADALEGSIYRITNVQTGTVLDMRSQEITQNGAQAQHYAWNGGTNQQWQLKVNDNGSVYFFFVVASEKVLDADYYNIYSQDAKIQQWDLRSDSNGNQGWLIIPVS